MKAIPQILLLSTVIFSFISCKQTKLDFGSERATMVRTQIEQRGISDPKILATFNSVPREEFVLPEFKARAYDDLEVPLGFGQTLDRPYEDALIITALDLKPRDRVLEVGTGSGYLAALMSKLAADVYTIEIEPPIAALAKSNFEKLGLSNVHPKTGDGFVGWPEFAPFNAIVLTCSPEKVPEPLIEQLSDGGRLILPIGGTKKFQELILYKKSNGRMAETRRVSPATFVPMKGKVLESK